MSLDVKVDSARLQKLFQLAPDELKRALNEAAGRVGSRFIGYHRARRLRGPPGVRGTRAQGFLSRKQIDYTVKGTTLANVVLDIRAKTRIAVEHEEGRAVYARDSSSLLVPMPQNGKFPSRSQLKRARRLAREGKLIAVQSKGKTYLGERRSARGKLRLLFVLKKKVQMKPRLAFFQTWREFKATQGRKLFFAGISFAIAAARRRARAG